MTAWTALLRRGPERVAHALRGAELLRTARGADAAEALAALDHGDARVVQLGEGAPDALPAAVLPEGGTGLPGLTQKQPADVIDAQVRLWLIGLGGWDGVAWVIGAEVSHWVHLSAGEAVSSLSSLTPRLRAALGGSLPPEADAITDTLSRPERLAAQLRVAQVAGGAGALSGHLLGAELAAARPYWLGQRVTPIAPEAVAPAHAAALEAQGVPVTTRVPETLEAAGLAALAGALGFEG